MFHEAKLMGDGGIGPQTYETAWGSFKNEIISTIIEFLFAQCVDNDWWQYFDRMHLISSFVGDFIVIIIFLQRFSSVVPDSYGHEIT